MKLEKKLSLRQILGTVKETRHLAEQGQGESVYVARIFGIGRSLKTGETDNGPWVAIMGEGKGINVRTGDEVRSSKVFLPAPADEMVASQVASLERGGAVEYGFDVFVREDQTAATGYVYEVEPIMEPGESDPLSMLENQIGGQLEDKSGGDTAQSAGSGSSAKSGGSKSGAKSGTANKAE